MERCSVVAAGKKSRNEYLRVKICARFAFAGLLTQASLAVAAGPRDNVTAVPAGSRNRASVVVVGDSRTAVNLAELLLPRLMDTSLELRFENVSRLSQVQLSGLMGESNARFVAVLDASQPDRWRLTIIDPQSDRAIARSLAGASVDQAAIEATISVIVSANQALSAGEIVGDLSVEAALKSQGLDQDSTLVPARSNPTPTAKALPTPPPRSEFRATTESSNTLAVELGIGVLGEPLAQPGGYGIDWTIALSARGLHFVTYAGPGLSMGFPTTVTTPLGQSEFHWLQLGAALGLLVRLTQWAELGLLVEPFGERVQARHRATSALVTARDTAATWGMAGRVGAQSHFWPTSNLGVGLTTGVVMRANAPTYVDSRDQTLLTTTPTAWFVQAGALFRLTP